VLRNGLTVIKFGISVLRGETDLPVVVEERCRHVSRLEVLTIFICIAWPLHLSSACVAANGYSF
jgi:hypothetical protein